VSTGPDQSWCTIGSEPNREAEQPIARTASPRQNHTISHDMDDLDPRETELLWNAVKDPRGEVFHSQTLSGEGMTSNGRQFLEGADARFRGGMAGSSARP